MNSRQKKRFRTKMMYKKWDRRKKLLKLDKKLDKFMKSNSRLCSLRSRMESNDK